jgi:hypothetical protein
MNLSQTSDGPVNDLLRTSRHLAARFSPHRPQPRFQPAVVGLDRVVRVALDDVQG